MGNKKGGALYLRLFILPGRPVLYLVWIRPAIDSVLCLGNIPRMGKSRAFSLGITVLSHVLPLGVSFPYLRPVLCQILERTGRFSPVPAILAGLFCLRTDSGKKSHT